LVSAEKDLPKLREGFKMIKEFARTGSSTTTNSLGMREMQQLAYEARDNQYILIKAPPASGKSRALMFLALDKVKKQKLKKVIVAVPERSIGASFGETKLTEFGFYADWNPEVNLCTSASNTSKVQTLLEFLKSDQTHLICTHATLRYAFKQSEASDYDNCLLAIDEFHHVSVSEDNILGDTLRQIMASSNAHIIAMTGSYFRGDSNAVLMPEDEAKFYPVTYTYYEQLNNYKYLKTLGIGHHFYQGKYLSAIEEVLNTDKKTIVHIPNVNSAESTKDKHEEVGLIIDEIGEFVSECEETGVITIKRKGDGKHLKIANLVEDDEKSRQRISTYLRENKEINDLDIIIALGMAKEGFDWPWCEHSLTIGYRRSLQEVVQIIGRCTRDSENKTHAQFTNLLALPIAADEKVHTAVNNVLKAVACSLLMEQVLAPVFKFKTKTGEPKIKGFKIASTDRTKQIVESDLNDLKVKLLEDPEIIAAANGVVDALTMNKDLVAKVVRKAYPDLSEDEVEEVRQAVVVDTTMKKLGVTKDEGSGSQEFIKIGDKLILVEELDIELIDSINPFQGAYEVLSKELSKDAFKQIQDHIASTRISVTEEECRRLIQHVKSFIAKNKREPSKNSNDPMEVRLYEVLLFFRTQSAKQKTEEKS
jgi:superfamily II DNA or RNA helicase